MGAENAGVFEAKRPEDIQDALDQRYARFGLRPLTDNDVWTLSMAAMVMPDGSPGAEAYLAQVSGTRIFDACLTLWGRVVAIGISQAAYKAPGGSRRRTYVEGYDESWGRYAVADGLTLALYGRADDAIGKSKDQGYRRVRDFVGGALVNAIAEYRVALEWAGGYRRDRLLAGRWESMTGLNFGDSRADATIHWEGSSYYPRFAPGCARIGNPADSDQRLSGNSGEPPKFDPETLYRGIRPSDWWDDGLARLARSWPVMMIYPATE